MATTNAMEDIAYEKRNFNMDPGTFRHPLWITDKWFFYPLVEDNTGVVKCVRDNQGKPMRTPRCLSQICIYHLVKDKNVLQNSKGHVLVSNIYPVVLSEAIYQREASAIEWLISTWPSKTLRVFDVIPVEDYLEPDYLTLAMEGNDNTSIVDCFILGLLKLKPTSRLKQMDFTGFEKDRTLGKELCRLPILWMKPEDRTAEKIHSYLSDTIDITKDKVERFLNRISVVYSNIDSDFKHGNKIENLTIILDLKVHVDDVPIGLGLQPHSPFKFACGRLWMKPIQEVGLTPCCISSVLVPSRITHFELEDPLLCQDESRVQSLMEGLLNLKYLVALSLPNTIDVNLNPQMAGLLNSVLLKLRYLLRLNFSYCNLQGQLSVLLGGMKRHLWYLNLTDCRLTDDDLYFLLSWWPVKTLRELNLSSNNLMFLDQVVISLLEKMSRITCLSLASCSLSIHSQALIALQCKESSHLKCVCIHGYTPLPQNDILEMLHICAQIRSLQKVLLFPEIYGFPGNDEEERKMNKYHMMRFSYRYLEMRGRKDIELE